MKKSLIYRNRIIASSFIVLGLSVISGCTPVSESETNGAEKALAKMIASEQNGSEAEKNFKAFRNEAGTPDKSADVSNKSAAKRGTVCDSIGKVVICTNGKSVCWWGPKNGYGCNF